MGGTTSTVTAIAGNGGLIALGAAVAQLHVNNTTTSQLTQGAIIESVRGSAGVPGLVVSSSSIARASTTITGAGGGVIVGSVIRSDTTIGGATRTIVAADVTASHARFAATAERTAEADTASFQIVGVAGVVSESYATVSASTEVVVAPVAVLRLRATTLTVLARAANTATAESSQIAVASCR